MQAQNCDALGLPAAVGVFMCTLETSTSAATPSAARQKIVQVMWPRNHPRDPGV